MATLTNADKKEATGPVISGGHLVAKALKNEGVEVIWTLCGGHIIDIYDGCLDEGIKIIDVRHRAGRRPCGGRLFAPERQDRLRGDDGWTGHDQRHDRHRQCLSRRKSAGDDRWTGSAVTAQDRLAARFAARRHHVADHQICRQRAAHGTGRRHGIDGVSRSGQWRAGTELFRNSPRRARRQGPGRTRAHSESRRLSRLDQIGRRSRRHRKVRRHSGQIGKTLRIVRHAECGLRAATMPRWISAARSICLVT